MPEEGDEEEDMDVDAMWHPIPDGLRTVRALSRELATEPHWRGLVDELQALERLSAGGGRTSHSLLPDDRLEPSAARERPNNAVFGGRS
jgi:hypothetical protein